MCESQRQRGLMDLILVSIMRIVPASVGRLESRITLIFLLRRRLLVWRILTSLRRGRGVDLLRRRIGDCLLVLRVCIQGVHRYVNRWQFYFLLVFGRRDFIEAPYELCVQSKGMKRFNSSDKLLNFWIIVENIANSLIVSIHLTYSPSLSTFSLLIFQITEGVLMSFLLEFCS